VYVRMYLFWLWILQMVLVYEQSMFMSKVYHLNKLLEEGGPQVGGGVRGW
jgi:hypothetical protein